MIRKFYAILITLTLIAGTIYGKSQSNLDVRDEANTIFGKKWVLTEFMGKPTEELNLKEAPPYITFDEKNCVAYGFGGVNSFNGKITLTEYSLKFGPLISTLMAGENMEFETSFLKTLSNINVYTLKGDTLYLTTNKMAPLMKFKEDKSPAGSSDNSMNCLDWNGIYKCLITDKTGKNTETILILNKDLTFIEKISYPKSSKKTVKKNGKFSWDESGSNITLYINDKTYKRFLVGENQLIILDLDGNKIKEKSAAKYILKKQ